MILTQRLKETQSYIPDKMPFTSCFTYKIKVIPDIVVIVFYEPVTSQNGIGSTNFDSINNLLPPLISEYLG